MVASSPVFHGAFPGVFRQERNIVNKVLYLNFLSLENEVFSYAVTGEALNYDAMRKELEQLRAAQAMMSPSQVGAKAAASNVRLAANGAGRQETPANGLVILVQPREFIRYVRPATGAG